MSKELIINMENQIDDARGHVKVMCRFRPLNSKELEYSNKVFVKVLEDETTVLARNTYDPNAPLCFSFDRVFSSEVTQATVYEVAAKPIVESVLRGFNGTVLAYGQTSSGKTYTMIGPDPDDFYYKGVIPRMINTVFAEIAESCDDIEFTVKISYCEIYLEHIRDLFDQRKQNLKIMEDKTRGIYIEDITEEYVATDSEVYELIKLGNSNREVAHTRMNVESSRSHAILVVTVSQNNRRDLSARTGKLYLVDLAGSEKVDKTKAKGKRLDEAKKINQSLSALGLVINSLTDGKSTHVPYRDSKLTRVLKESLGGNSKTCLIIACSPSPYNENETLSTLRFGVRAKAIKNKAKINRELTIPELKLLLAQSKDEIAQKHARISELEKIVVEMGGTVPTILESTEEEKSNNQMQELEEELNYERERLADEIESSKGLKEEVESLKMEIEILRKENEDFTSNEISFAVKLGEAKSKLADANDTIEQLKKEVTSLQGHAESLRETNGALEAKLEAKHIQISSEELDRLREMYRESEEKIQEKEESSEKLRLEIEALQAKLEGTSETAALKSKVNEMETMMNNFMTNYQKPLSEDEKAAYERKILRRDDRIKELMGYIKQAKDKMNEYKNRLSSPQFADSNSIRGGHKIKKIIKGGNHPRLAGILSQKSYPKT